MKIYVADRYHVSDYGSEFMPNLSSGFMWFEGHLREVREVHHTNKGIQIELYDWFVWG